MCRTDDGWHHIAVTWDYESGAASLFFDGSARVPFYKYDYGNSEEALPWEGGVAPTVAARTERSGSGSLVLGQVG